MNFLEPLHISSDDDLLKVGRGNALELLGLAF